MSKQNLITLITILAVILAMAVIVAVLVNNDDGGNGKGSITITDGTGETITLDGPLESCMCINTDSAKAIAVLGLQDKVSDIIFKKAKKVDTYRNMGFTVSDDAPTITTMKDIEYFLSKGVKFILEPATGSSKLSSEIELKCKSAGITIIKLDCYGETMYKDMGKLVTIFGDEKKSKDRYDQYCSYTNGIKDTVMSKCDPSTNGMFLIYYQSMTAFYNQNSEASKIIESVYGKNALKDVKDLPLTGVSNKLGPGLYESLRVINDDKGIGSLIIRASEGADETAIKNYWNATDINGYTFDWMDDGTGQSRVFSIDTDIFSGSMGYILYVALADTMGIETGYSVSDLVEEHNRLYGTKKDPDGLVYRYVFDGNVCTSVTDITS